MHVYWAEWTESEWHGTEQNDMCIEREELSKNDIVYKELALIQQITCLCLPIS